MIDFYGEKNTYYFDLGCAVASIERTSSWYYKTTIKDETTEVVNLFSTLERALLEVLSYANVDEGYWGKAHFPFGKGETK